MGRGVGIARKFLRELKAFFKKLSLNMLFVVSDLHIMLSSRSSNFPAKSCAL